MVEEGREGKLRVGRVVARQPSPSETRRTRPTPPSPAQVSNPPPRRGEQSTRHSRQEKRRGRRRKEEVEGRTHRLSSLALGPDLLLERNLAPLLGADALSLLEAGSDRSGGDLGVLVVPACRPRGRVGKGSACFEEVFCSGGERGQMGSVGGRREATGERGRL